MPFFGKLPNISNFYEDQLKRHLVEIKYEFSQVCERMIQHHLAPVHCCSFKATGVVTEWPILC